MIYGIYVTKENYDVYAGGSKKRTSIAMGWYRDACYDSMRSAKIALDNAKDSLQDDCYDIVKVNSVTFKGVRYTHYDIKGIAPVKLEERVVYHIEKR